MVQHGTDEVGGAFRLIGVMAAGVAQNEGNDSGSGLGCGLLSGSSPHWKLQEQLKLEATVAA
jgi:hypothetical protein